MKRLILFLVVATVGGGLGRPADARSVYLNDVNIDSILGQKFDNCSVEIDAQGNVRITAKGYKVSAVGASSYPTSPPPDVLTKRYWLVTEKPAPGMDQYDVDVFVNNLEVRKVGTREGQIYLEITKFVKPGPNTVYIMAKKNLGEERKSTNPAHYSRIIIGEGDVSGKTIMINKQLLDYRATAAQTTDMTETFSIEGR